jgi:hypothetical protein
VITYTAKNADYRCKFCIKQKDLDVMELTKARSANGQFPKGFSGNPGGRPRDEQKVAELARSYTKEAIETLVELMRRGNDERVRGTAAQALLDRGWGKPKVEVVSDEAGYVQALRAVAAELDERPDNRLV